MNISSKKKIRPFSKLASHAYSKKTIEKKALEGTHNGESMELIFKKIMNDPNVTLGEIDKQGNQAIFYNDEDIGWVNPNRMIGWIDQVAYDKLQDYVEPTEEAEVAEEESVSDDIINASENITAAVKIVSKDDLEQAIKDTLDDDMCQSIIDLAYSEDDSFADDRFEEIETFADIYFGNESDPLEIVNRFWFGQDLDYHRGGDGAGACPQADYARFDAYGNVETTDYPGRIYLEENLGEIVDYIMDHLEDDLDFPDEIQELIDEYTGYIEEDESDAEDEEAEGEE